MTVDLDGGIPKDCNFKETKRLQWAEVLVTMENVTKKTTQVLEINLISAQGLKVPFTCLRRTQTYAVMWVSPTAKVRTRVDRISGGNPTWNDRFLFQVTPDFLCSETSGVTVEIFAVGYFRDDLIGSVRVLISNLLGVAEGKITPSFGAFQIREHSGKFHGVLNIGAVIIKGSGLPTLLNGIPAIRFSDLLCSRLERQKKNEATDKVKKK